MSYNRVLLEYLVHRIIQSWWIVVESWTMLTLFSSAPGVEDVGANHNEHRPVDSTQSSPIPPYRESGPLINRKPTTEREWANQASNPGLLWPRIRHYCRAPFAEFMGTFILIMFGDGVVAQVVLSNGSFGEYQSISWGWVSGHSATSISPNRANRK